ncbi:MAG: hypothetical protein IKU55_00445 [Clostridia bacterium]|nr:hypothetical protein [Clostridia bacterium]
MKHTRIRRLLSCLLAVICLLQTAVGAISYEDTRELTEEEQIVLNDLYDLNVMQGGGASFRADSYMTYQELCRVVYSIAVGGETEAPAAYYGEKLLQVSGLRDTASVSAWALPYVGYCFFNKLWIGDANGALLPRTPVTYYDCASILLKLLGLPVIAQTETDAKVEIVRYAMAVGLLDSQAVDDVFAPMTRLDVAMMISKALDAHTIASAADGVLRYASETGLKRWFRVNTVDQLRKSGVVTGKTTENGKLYLTVRSDSSEYRYPATDALYGKLLGRIVCWSEKRSGEILSPIRSEVSSFSARLGEISYRNELGRVIVDMGEAELTFARNLLNCDVYFLNMATAEISFNQTFLTATSLMKTLSETVGKQYGMQTVVDLAVSDDAIVVRLFPRMYLRYDSAVGAVRSDTAVYPAADPKFVDVPDGSMVAVLVNCASREIILEEVLAPLDLRAVDFRAKAGEDGDYVFTLDEAVVHNRTALTDAELAEYAAQSARKQRYLMLDGDGIAAIGAFAEYRPPYTDAVSPYMLVSTYETIVIGSKTYTALHGWINGKVGCELVDPADLAEVQDENRLFILNTETTAEGLCVVRPKSVADETSGLFGKVGIGQLTESLFVEGKSREIVVDGQTLRLADDCITACAEADGTPGTYRLSNLLVLDGKGRDEHRDHTFRAIYGLDADGTAIWLMLVRIPVK